jgi:Do/DeqQ family serine protease
MPTRRIVYLYAFAAALLAIGGCRRAQSTHTSSATRVMTESDAGSVRLTPAGRIESYSDVVDRAAPAVVTVRSARHAREPREDDPYFDESPLRRFFGGRPPQGGGELQHALGSGVLVRPDGYILTNHHVIEGAEEIKVDLTNRQTYSAKLVGSDPPSDLAVLKIEAANLPVLPLGNSDSVRIGDVVLAIGNPLAIGETVTSGIISAKGRATGSGDGSFQDFLQTDAPINQGNSGGALVNTRAELIGINSQILSPTGGNIGIGFAIPCNMAHNVMDQLIANGKVRRSMLGVSVQSITSDLAAGLGMKGVRGILVNSVTPGSPAEHAGIKTGDVITTINGTTVNDANALRNLVSSAAPGSDMSLTVLRDGREQQLHAKVGELTSDARQKQEGSNEGAPASGRLGISAMPLTPEIASQLGLARGVQGVVVDSVDPDGPAANAGIERGDVIQRVNNQPVRTAEEVRGALSKSGDRPTVLLVNRRGQTMFLAVPLR